MRQLKAGRIPEGWTGQAFCKNCGVLPSAGPHWTVEYAENVKKGRPAHLGGTPLEACPWCHVSKAARYAVKVEMCRRPEYAAKELSPENAEQFSQGLVEVFGASEKWLPRVSTWTKGGRL